MSVFLVYVDSDLTEGKGAMRLSKIFSLEENARKWMEAQPDPWHAPNRDWSEDGHRYGHMSYAEWEVITDDISDLDAVLTAVAEEALASLTSDQRRAVNAHFRNLLT